MRVTLCDNVVFELLSGWLVPSDVVAGDVLQHGPSFGDEFSVDSLHFHIVNVTLNTQNDLFNNLHQAIVDCIDVLFVSVVDQTTEFIKQFFCVGENQLAKN